MKNREVWITGTARTAIGSFGGSLEDVPLSELATIVCRAAIERSGPAPEQVGHVVIGNVVPTEPEDTYLSRVATVIAGVPFETPAFNINRLCSSISAAQGILLGDTEVALGGGAKSMSRESHLQPALR